MSFFIFLLSSLFCPFLFFLISQHRVQYKRMLLVTNLTCTVPYEAECRQKGQTIAMSLAECNYFVSSGVYKSPTDQSIVPLRSIFRMDLFY